MLTTVNGIAFEAALQFGEKLREVDQRLSLKEAMCASWKSPQIHSFAPTASLAILENMGDPAGHYTAAPPAP